MHIHARDEAKGGGQTAEISKVKAVYDAIKQRVPDIVIQITSSVGAPCPAKGSYEQVEVAVKVASCVGREPATPAEARKILGIVR